MLIMIIYFVLGFCLYLLNSYLIKKYDITMVKSIALSLLYVFILAGMFSYHVKFTSNIFIILVFYLIIDIIYTTYFIGDDFFSSNKIKYYFTLLFIGFIANVYFINKVDNIFLDAEQIKLVIWVLIIVYLYKFVTTNKIYNLKFKSNSSFDKETIGFNFVKLKSKYKLNYEDKDLELIIYSLMIFNNRRRNILMRKLDNLIFSLNNKSRKLSIMLVESDKLISDDDGITIVYEKLCDIKKKSKSISTVLKKYDPNNYEEIYSIVKIIEEYFK